MNGTTEKTLEQFIKEEGIGAQFEKVAANPHMTMDDEWSRTATHYRVKLYSVKENHSQTMWTYYSTGSAITEQPTVADVLDSLASDAASVEEMSFEEWASDFGYDTDSRSAEATYNACKREADDLADLLETDDAYDTLLHNIERL
jgi:hypothetical protein